MKDYACSALTLLLLLLFPASPVSAKKPAPKPHPKTAPVGLPAGAGDHDAVWTPSAVQLARLGPVATQYGFGMRLPAGFLLVRDEFDRDHAARRIGWNAPAAAASPSGAITALIGTTFGEATPEEAVSRYQNLSVEPNYTDLTESDMADGTVSGLAFARMYWKGTSKETPGRLEHGFTYATVDGPTVYVFSCFDDEPRYKDSLPLAEAAVQTFQPQSEAALAAAPLPDLGKPQHLEPGVLFYEVTLFRRQIATRLWIYLPEHPGTKTVPCVFVAPGGTRLFHGAGLSLDSRQEQLPYVHDGLAVVAYDLDGGLDDNPSGDDIGSAAQAFLNAEGGAADAEQAIAYALAKVPLVDPNRLYAAGCGSAGSISLLVAERDPRIKACVACAPTTDLPGALGAEEVRSLDARVLGFADFLRRISPNAGASALRCPLFLFHADDDTVSPTAQTLNFAVQVQRTNPQVTLDRIPTGDHYDSMIQEGIPDAVRWLDSLPSK